MSWFDKSIDSDSIFANTNYTIVRRDRSETLSNTKKSGGGTFMLIKNHIDFMNITPPTEKFVEFTAIRIKLPRPIILVDVYVPSYSRGRSYNELEDFIACVENKWPSSSIVAIGDFNCPYVDWQSDNDMALRIRNSNEDSILFWLQTLVFCGHKVHT